MVYEQNREPHNYVWSAKENHQPDINIAGIRLGIWGLFVEKVKKVCNLELSEFSCEMDLGFGHGIEKYLEVCVGR